jgi:hypothetical protein
MRSNGRSGAQPPFLTCDLVGNIREITSMSEEQAGKAGWPCSARCCAHMAGFLGLLAKLW